MRGTPGAGKDPALFLARLRALVLMPLLFEGRGPEIIFLSRPDRALSTPREAGRVHVEARQAEHQEGCAQQQTEYAAARRGLYLTVHALAKVKEVLKWELAGDREKALVAGKGPPSTDIERRQSTERKLE
jgi:hypothetical protein